MAFSKAIAWRAPVRIAVQMGANVEVVDTSIFTADDDYEVVEVTENHAVAGTDVGAVTLDVKKCTGTQAPSAGASVLASTFDLKGAANTVVRKSAAGGGLTATLANRLLARGDRLAIDITGTTTAVAGVCVCVTLLPVGRPSW